VRVNYSNSFASHALIGKITKKQYLLRFFLEMFGYKTFVKIYLIHPEILSVINSRESGFSRILKSEGGYWVPETSVEQP
jgi:hypothetical protein